MRKALLLLISGLAASSTIYAQADKLMDMLDEGEDKNKKEEVTATFKATRLINNSTVENLAHGVLDFRILHRFGRVSDGEQNFFGIDNATTRIGLDYGVTRWLMVGIGHNTFRKANDGFMKVRLLPQQTNGIPVTITYFGGVSVDGGEEPKLPNGWEYYFTNRMAFTHQLLIARKFSNRLSLQLMPSLVHFNLVDSAKFDNNTISIGIGGRIKVSRRVAITGEYHYRITNSDITYAGSKTYNSLSLGADIETGGHVFQLFFTNSSGITEPAMMNQTTDTWSKGQLHFGFNISRVFTVVKPKEFKDGKKW